MKRFVFACAAGLLGLAPLSPAMAAVQARISIAQQRMEVVVDGKLVHTWAVSTGRDDFDTPTGNYTPTWLDRDHHSQKYDDAPMPYAVFFRGGFAVHGTTSLGMLGRRASHGCVRLSPANARQFFELVNGHGLASTKIVIQNGRLPGGEPVLVADRAASPSQGRGRRDASELRRARVSHVRSADRDTPPRGDGQLVLYYAIGANGQIFPVVQPIQR